MSEQWHGGKGSTQRPTDSKKYNDNYDRIFKDRERMQECLDSPSHTIPEELTQEDRIKWLDNTVPETVDNTVEMLEKIHAADFSVERAREAFKYIVISPNVSMDGAE